MKKRIKNLPKSSCTLSEEKAPYFDQLDQLMVQQRYHSELEKYQEQINKKEQLGSQDGQAA